MAVTADAVTARPTAMLPSRQLGLISVYWFGINAVWGAYEGFGQKQIELIVGKGSVGSVMGPLELLGGLVAILTVPTIGAVSDYTTSRFGKRKGYIITGAGLRPPLHPWACRSSPWPSRPTGTARRSGRRACSSSTACSSWVCSSAPTSPRALPGLRARPRRRAPGRCGQRTRRRHAHDRPGRWLRHHGRGRPLRAVGPGLRHRRPRRVQPRRADLHLRRRRPTGHAPWGPVVAFHRRSRPGTRASCASAPSCA